MVSRYSFGSMVLSHMLSTQVHHMNVVNTLYRCIHMWCHLSIIIYGTLPLAHAMSCIAAFCTINVINYIIMMYFHNRPVIAYSYK